MKHTVLLSYLQQYHIPYILHEHEPIFTCNDGEHLKSVIPGRHNKNLFLSDPKGMLFLITVLDSKRVDLKALALQLNCKRFSFASAEELFARLQVLPGSVTPYGLMFNSAKNISYYIDEDVMASEWVNFHPLRNDMTLSLKPVDFIQFLEIVGHPLKTLQIPEKLG